MDEKRQQLGQEHQKKDDAVFKFFREAMEDVGSVFRTDEQQRIYASERAQTVVVFTFADVVANYWYEYLDKTGKPSERFLTWINRYCINEHNSSYCGTDFTKLSAERMYSFRSSMVHFLGISNPKEEKVAIGITSNRISDDEIQKWRAGFQQAGHTAIIFKPKQLYNLILDGAMLMLDDWKNIIDLSQTDEIKKWEHIEGIDRIYRKIRLEGAVLVAVPPKQPE